MLTFHRKNQPSCHHFVIVGFQEKHMVMKHMVMKHMVMKHMVIFQDGGWALPVSHLGFSFLQILAWIIINAIGSSNSARIMHGKSQGTKFPIDFNGKS